MSSAKISTSNQTPTTGLSLRSLVTASGTLELTLEPKDVELPKPDDVVVRIDAAPVNPSDLGLLLGAADPLTAKIEGEGPSRRTTIVVPEAGRRAMAGRLGKAMTVG